MRAVPAGSWWPVDHGFEIAGEVAIQCGRRSVSLASRKDSGSLIV